MPWYRYQSRLFNQSPPARASFPRQVHTVSIALTITSITDFRGSNCPTTTVLTRAANGRNTLDTLGHFSSNIPNSAPTTELPPLKRYPEVVYDQHHQCDGGYNPCCNGNDRQERRDKSQSRDSRNPLPTLLDCQARYLKPPLLLGLTPGLLGNLDFQAFKQYRNAGVHVERFAGFAVDGDVFHMETRGTRGKKSRATSFTFNR